MVRFPLEEMKYLIFLFPCFGIEEKLGVERMPTEVGSEVSN